MKNITQGDVIACDGEISATLVRVGGGGHSVKGTGDPIPGWRERTLAGGGMGGENSSEDNRWMGAKAETRQKWRNREGWCGWSRVREGEKTDM